MASFRTVDGAKPRFGGEFAIEPSQPYSPTADESAFVTRIVDLVDALATASSGRTAAFVRGIGSR